MKKGDMVMGLFDMFKGKISDKIELPAVSGKALLIEETSVIEPKGLCVRDKSRKRQDIIRGMNPGDKLFLQPCLYYKQPSHMIIDCETGLDIGYLATDVTERIRKSVRHPVIIGELGTVDDGRVYIKCNVYEQK